MNRGDQHMGQTGHQQPGGAAGDMALAARAEPVGRTESVGRAEHVVRAEHVGRAAQVERSNNAAAVRSESAVIAASAAGSAPGAAGFCLSCWLASLTLAGLVWASFTYLKIDFGGLVSAESRGYMWKFFVSFFPPNLSPEFLAKTFWGTLETLAISGIGTLLAAVAGLLLALPASGRLGSAFREITRLLLNVLRSVPELVWAALMVLAAGLGPFAGALALALHTTGVLGRLFAETLENAPPEPARALTDMGAGAGIAFVYGTLPNVTAQLLAYSLYRWEMNIRMAAILGFVGAGGLGQLLYFHLSIFQQAEASTVIIAMLLLVVLVDGVSSYLRRGFVRAGA